MFVGSAPNAFDRYPFRLASNVNLNMGRLSTLWPARRLPSWHFMAAGLMIHWLTGARVSLHSDLTVELDVLGWARITMDGHDRQQLYTSRL